MEAQMRVFFSQYAHVDPAELRKAFKKALKLDKSDVIQSELCDFISKHKKMSLTRLRKELAAAYKTVHDNDSDTERPMRKYNVFFKEQSEILKDEMKETTQIERVKEIARRWKAQKELEAEMADEAATLTVTETVDEVPHATDTDTEPPLASSAAQVRAKKGRHASSDATPKRVSKRNRVS